MSFEPGRRPNKFTRRKHSISMLDQWARGFRDGQNGGQCAKGVACFKDGKFVKWFWCGQEAIRQGYGSTVSGISNVTNGRRKMYKGYEWKFMEKPPDEETIL